nr:2597_t:CDS:2 [Entrophospora candida]
MESEKNNKDFNPTQEAQTKTSVPPLPSKDILVKHSNTCKDTSEENQNCVISDEDTLDPFKLFSHLVLLNQFKKLELEDEKIDARYLLRAINRYILWLRMLNEQEEKENLPIPPIDVCYIWHSHCLSPINYYEDTYRLHNINLSCYYIPLEKMVLWENYTKMPWILDPNDDSDFILVCPWCNDSNFVKWDKYVDLVRNPNDESSSVMCNKCKVILTPNNLSAKRFLDDINDCISHTENKYTRIGEIDAEAASDDIDLLFSSAVMHKVPKLKELLESSKDSSLSCNWENISQYLSESIAYLKKEKQFKLLNNNTIVEKVIISYKDNIFPFAFSLLDAVNRQRKFTHKMVVNCCHWICNYQIQNNAIKKYECFMKLIGKNPYKCIVPTLDIDLAWHTHMLNPKFYKKYTMEKTKRFINHDDSIEDQVIDKSFKETCKLWYKEFDELYTNTVKPSDYLFSKKQKILGVLAFPFGAYMLTETTKVTEVYKKSKVGGCAISNNTGTRIVKPSRSFFKSRGSNSKSSNINSSNVYSVEIEY